MAGQVAQNRAIEASLEVRLEASAIVTLPKPY
jgi:hypothetical protein